MVMLIVVFLFMPVANKRRLSPKEGMVVVISHEGMVFMVMGLHRFSEHGEFWRMLMMLPARPIALPGTEI
jgi:hypothetical protein